MADIDELGQRVSAALDRIGAGLDAASGGNTAALEAALAEEKTANAQLEARVQTLKEQHEAHLAEAQAATAARLAELEAEVTALRGTAQDATSQNRALRQANQRLNAAAQNLREAASGEVGPHLLNQTMMTEIEGLRAARAADRAEVDEILTAIKPMLKEN